MKRNAEKVLEEIETGATLSSGTTIGSNTAIQKGNMATDLDSDTVAGIHGVDIDRGPSSSLKRHLGVEQLGLMAWYPFEFSAGGTVDDWTAINGEATLNNGAGLIAGQVGNAVSFDGTDDFVGTDVVYQSGNGSKTHGLTVSFWLNKHSGGDSGQRYISCDLSDWWGFWENTSGEVRFTVRDGSDTANEAAGTYTQDTWEHWTGVVDLSVPEVRLYKNASQVASATMSTANWGDGNTTRYLNIGCGSESGTYNTSQSGTFSACDIDEFRLYHRTLSDSTITDIYNGTA